jgi:hypothetical protein
MRCPDRELTRKCIAVEISSRPRVGGAPVRRLGNHNPSSSGLLKTPSVRETARTPGTPSEDCPEILVFSWRPGGHLSSLSVSTIVTFWDEAPVPIR